VLFFLGDVGGGGFFFPLAVSVRLVDSVIRVPCVFVRMAAWGILGDMESAVRFGVAPKQLGDGNLLSAMGGFLP